MMDENEKLDQSRYKAIAAQILVLLDGLSDQGREGVFSIIGDKYCVHCGDKIIGNGCWCQYSSPYENYE